MILAGQTVFITSRCVNRTFRFVPKKKVVATLGFCLGSVLSKYRIQLHEFVFMSNHMHLVLTAEDDRLPDFMRDLNSMISRAMNALRGRNGTNMESHYNMVVPADTEKVLEHCAYTLANPCESHLVTAADKWRGLTSAQMSYGDKLTFMRPPYGLWSRGRARAAAHQSKKRRKKKRTSAGRAKHAGRWVTPDVVSIELTPPPGFGGTGKEELRDRVMQKVVQCEAKAERERAEKGWRVLGMRKVMKQHWNDYPKKPEDMFGPVPKASSTNKWARMEKLQQCAVFQAAYQAARSAFIAGEREVEFPHGTWQMKKRFNVACALASP